MIYKHMALILETFFSFSFIIIPLIRVPDVFFLTKEGLTMSFILGYIKRIFVFDIFSREPVFSEAYVNTLRMESFENI